MQVFSKKKVNTCVATAVMSLTIPFMVRLLARVTFHNLAEVTFHDFLQTEACVEIGTNNRSSHAG